MDCRFNLEQLAHDLIPSWATRQGLPSRADAKMLILKCLGRLTEYYQDNDNRMLKLHLGLCFTSICIWYAINRDKPSVNVKGTMYNYAELCDLLILCAKSKSIPLLKAIAEKMNLDLEECANLAYNTYNEIP